MRNCWLLNGLPPHMQKLARTDADSEEKVALMSYALKCGNTSCLEHIWIIESRETAYVFAQREMFA